MAACPCMQRRCLHAAKRCFSAQIHFHICTVSRPCAARPTPALLFACMSPRTCTCMHNAGTRSFLSFSLASHTHARRLLQALQMCVLDPLPTQAILMPVCWLRLFHTPLWNERRRHWSPPAARVPDSSHGFKVRPVSKCLPATQLHTRGLSPLVKYVFNAEPRWSSRAWRGAAGWAAVSGAWCLWGRLLLVWPPVCCSMLADWQLCSGDLVVKPAFKKGSLAPKQIPKLLPYGRTYSRWNELHSCQAGDTTASSEWMCLGVIKFVAICWDVSVNQFSSVVHITWIFV